MKKFRGKKRYFRNMWEEVNNDVSYDQSECEEVYYIQSKEQGIRL
ncbi:MULTISPECIES: hypothetical protein [Bacillus]|nr:MULTISPECIES: hypothetical protein [Bacillus]MDF2001138.1 hypothetical protein [Bacillus pumilus]MDF2022393.1 hypothetical protein [Bacillus pumilus]MDF2026020.1 hypothetical protein [Bacillus pumilus]MDF2087203.1 hypothetical protein [Bacillus pumilus]MDG4727062.1 hypothetical protein [Bacillus pumilus]